MWWSVIAIVGGAALVAAGSWAAAMYVTQRSLRDQQKFFLGLMDRFMTKNYQEFAFTQAAHLSNGATGFVPQPTDKVRLMDEEAVQHAVNQANSFSELVGARDGSDRDDA